MSAAVAVGLLAAIVAGCAVLAAVMVMHSERVLRSIIGFSATRIAPADGLFDRMSRLPPYRWLFEGMSWGEVQESAVAHPERLHRILAAYRIMGLVVLVMAALLIAVVVGGFVISVA